MPKIPTVQNRAGFAALRLPRPRAFDIGGGAGRALEGLGLTLGDIARQRQLEAQRLQQEADKKIERAAEASFETTALTDFRELVNVEGARLKQELPLGVKGFANKFSTALEKQRDKILKGAPTQEIRNVVRGKLGNILDHTMDAARDFERHETVKKFTADLVNNLDRKINAIIRNPESLRESLLSGVTAIAAARGTLILSASEASDMEADLIERGHVAHVEARIADELEVKDVKADLDAGKFDEFLPPDQLKRLRDKAAIAIRRLETRAEAERKENERAVGRLVVDFGDSKERGFDWQGPNGESEEDLAELVKGTEHEQKFQEIIQASEALGKFNQLPPLAQEQVLRQNRAGEKTGFEAKFFSALERAHEATKQELKDDAFSFAIKQKVIPEPGPLDPGNLAGSLRERSKLAGVVEARYDLRDPVSPLTDDELGTLVSLIESSAADKRVRVFQELRAGLDDRHINAVAAQLTKKSDKVLPLVMSRP